MGTERDGRGRGSLFRPDTLALAGALLVIVLLVALLAGRFPGAAPAAANQPPAPGASPAAETPTTASATATATATTSALPSITPTGAATEAEATISGGNMGGATIVPTATPSPIPTATPTSAAAQEIMTAEATIAANGPLPTPRGAYSWTLQVPILMYHYISVPPPGADAYRRDLSVSPADFQAQMQYLVENGYTTVTLEDLSLAITAKRDLPPKAVIVTLDDGYRDNYDQAFPVLRELGLTATIFVATDFVDRGDPNYLTWEMVAEMDAAGIRFEPHSKSHADLSGRQRDLLLYEIKGSRETLEARLGRQPHYFAYPGGRYDQATIAVLDELGYWGAVTTAFELWHGFEKRFEWGRVRMRGATTLAEFADMVRVRE